MARRPQPGEPVYGTSWRRHGARRSRAARIARLLRPVAHLMGGFASTELIVPHRRRWYRPDVGVVIGGEPVADGVLARAPMLVVRLGGPLPAEAWLAAGARVVWARDDEGAVVDVRRDGRRHVAHGEWLAHPDEPALRLAADELRAPAGADARISA
jgi:hypothetical protein